MLHDRLSIDPREHPLLVTEPAWNTRAAREALTELAFEQEQVPAYYIACQSVLSAFAAGKGTALILDVGHDLASAVPVSEGYALRAGTMRQPLAVGLLKAQLKAHFAAPHSPHRSTAVNLTPYQLLSKRQPRPERIQGTTQSWRDWAEGRVVEDWIESCAEVLAPRGYDLQYVIHLIHYASI
jgi:actin-related protein